ncbi:hypothetical protein [Rathayibacter sp. VKM Ac-2857]|uniref:hypothetical protein n=1 Tax=Rathayibacter sp. VKM Ac-2857 TaxID=2739020 RepID=UPI0015647EB0|nr:hypothetical protein [Rathayibacter sp. VKM Ac-2857]NQX17266.1 hypothetical protein [Rathayibacter sp. VKM Ac-2857]
MTPPTPPARPRNTVGLVAFVLAIVQTLTQILLAGLTTAVPVLAFEKGIDATSIAALFVGIGLGQLLLAAATTVLAVVGVLRTGLPRALAWVALGVGAHGVLVGLATLVLPPLVGLVLQ